MPARGRAVLILEDGTEVELESMSLELGIEPLPAAFRRPAASIEYWFTPSPESRAFVARVELDHLKAADVLPWLM